MLIDYHAFKYHASVPWPVVVDPQIDWEYGIRTIESWLNNHIGGRFTRWAWNDSGSPQCVGVSFRWDQDRTLFVLTWS